MKTLVLIEGPGKRESVQKYLGDNYKVVPTFGHIRDLPTKGLGVNVLKDFEPEYVVAGDKKKVVKNLQDEYKKADGVLIATDPDREGEAIAWHVCEVLGIDKNSNCRITYNQIEKNTVQEAAKHPRPIDQKLVDAQQARRVLDRLVGYKISPILCKKIQANMSAGRVQSVTLKLVVDRDREIENFKPEEYWALVAKLTKEGKKEVIKASFVDGKDKKIKTKEQMDKIIEKLSAGKFFAKSVKREIKFSHPSAPFTTSTMQKEAGNKLGMSLKVISATAQTLYEGAPLTTGGKQALVTYIRTDSTRVSPEAQKMARDFITEKYGDKYLPKVNRVYKNKKDAQDAHEAIRPISLANTPEKMQSLLGKNEYKLYKLIYDRFLASQMADAAYDSLSVDIENSGYKFKTTGRVQTFDGYTLLYNNATEEDDEDTSAKLPDIAEGDELKQKELIPEQKFTKAPPRYTESSLVDAMESKGIGRPATYTQTVSVLYARNYIEKEKGKAIKSTELGRVAVDYLVKHFENIMDIGFTADMENKLDDIEYEGKNWQSVVSEFYGPFEQEIKAALRSGDNAKIPDEVSDVKCDKCGSMMVIRTGKFGKFLACPNYPKCKNTKPLEDDRPVVAKCPKCGKNVRRLKNKKGKYFYGCEGYPDCDYVSWDIPANENCPNCNTPMIVKLYQKTKVISCPKCGFNNKVTIKSETEENENTNS
ncbi:MAG: type I DNA topoisomerase [Clostridia bacterium]|nr:type I DNA topoisomerase [Clostridia bacterium]